MKAIKPMMYDTLRCYGDMPAPVPWRHCDYCGGRIGVGDTYYSDGKVKVCEECKKRFKPMTAEKEYGQHGMD
jgi:hypothetical protein